MLNEFLSRVLPSNGPYCLVLSYSATNQMKQIPCETLQDLSDTAYNYMEYGGDLYFGLASYKQGYHDNVKGELNNYGKVRQVFRTHENVKAIKSLWLDIDVGENKDYKSLEEAIQNLVSFTETVGLQFPLTVMSGNGLHCYWSLDNELTLQEWKPIATKLKQICNKLAFKVDPSRTSDPSSILRIPTTYNYKDINNPKQVQILYNGVHGSSVIEAINKYADSVGIVIDESLPSFGAPVQTISGVSAADLAVLGGASGGIFEEKADRDARPIILGCKQIQESGTSIEPVWFGMMTVMRLCFNGKDAVHGLSAMDKLRYNHANTESKYNYVTGTASGPMRCDSFNDANPCVCTNCPHFGRITSPIELGRHRLEIPVKEIPVVQEQVTPTIDPNGNPVPLLSVTAPVFDTTVTTFNVDDLNSVVINELRSDVLMAHSGFTFNNGCVMCNVSDDPTSTKTRLLFDCIPHLKLVQESILSTNETQLVYVWEIERNGNTQEMPMSTMVLTNDSKLIQWLADLRMFPDPKLQKRALNFMRGYLAKVQSKIKTMTVVSRFGWVDTKRPDGSSLFGFAIGNEFLSAKAEPEVVGTPPMAKQYSEQALSVAGTFENWQASLALYDNDNWGKLAVLLGFGAVLMQFHSDNAKNCIINFYSEASGTGKSTTLSYISSVWGNPDKQLVTTTTDNAMFALLEMRNNLPFCLDEITNRHGEELSELVFTNAGGTGKYRMNQKSEVVTASNWSTLTLTSANNTIGDKLAAFASSRQGEQRRAIDIPVPTPTISRDVASPLVSLMKQNYGHAGRKFIQFILDTDGVVEKLPEVLSATSVGLSQDGADRFWTNALASAYVAGCLCKSAGILNYDMEEMYTYMKSIMDGQKAVVSQGELTGMDILHDFLADIRRSTLIVTNAVRPNNMNETPSNMVDPYIKYMPQGTIDCRIELDTNTAYVRSSVFKDWCNDRQHSLNSLIMYASQNGFAERLPRNVFLSRGVSSAVKQQARSYKFTLPKDFDATLESVPV